MAIISKSTGVVCLIALVLMATVLFSSASNLGCDKGPVPEEKCDELCCKLCGNSAPCHLEDDGKFYCCCEPVRQGGSMRPQEVAEMIQT
uniref:Uncharacterized protein n=1 Tax=Aegilops tauschii subsp. strangulata TaxID=200361 RepID=A0A453JPA0_AEGTS